MLQLFSASGCPYAQRVRALAEHLEVPFELREIDLANKPPEFQKLSPTGRVPLLVDGDLKLYESFVLLQYVSEKYGFEGALAKEPGLRARQRLAMLQFDAIVSGAVMKSVREAKYDPDPAFERELDELGETVGRTGSGPSLLAFHTAPFWLRWGWLGGKHLPALGRIHERPALVKWLDDAVALKAVQATQPDRAGTERLFLEKFGPQAARKKA